MKIFGGRGIGEHGGIEQKRKLMDMDNSMVIVGGRAWVEVEEGMKGINGEGKYKIKIKG